MLSNRIAIATSAVAALGVGVAVGSTHQDHGSGPAPVATAASQSAQTPEQLCKQAAQQLRAKHPEVYVGACNSGEATLPVP